MPDPAIIDDPEEPQTLEEDVGFLERRVSFLKRRVSADATALLRMQAENAGLYEQIQKLEQENADLDERREALLQGLSPLLDWFDEYEQMYIDLAARNAELEGEVLMLRRRRGSGVGRGRQPEWTKGHAAEVQKRHTVGMSLRRIADETRLTLSQVRTIIKPRPVAEAQGISREEKIARRLIEAKRAAAELVNNVTRANKARLAEEAQAKEQRSRKRRRT